MKKIFQWVLLVVVFLAGAPPLNAWQEPSRTLPPSLNAPGVGDSITDFTLPAAAGGEVTVSEFLARQPGDEPGWVLLVFFRGTW